MRVTAVIVLVVALFFIISPMSHATTGKVNVTASLYDLRVSDVGPPGLSAGDSRSEIYRIWNRTVSAAPIGNAIVRCVFMGRGTVFGSGIFYCHGTYTIGSGKTFGRISIDGPRRMGKNASFLVTGTTGYYEGSSGSLVVRPADAPSLLSLVFILRN